MVFFKDSKGLDCENNTALIGLSCVKIFALVFYGLFLLFFDKITGRDKKPDEKRTMSCSEFPELDVMIIALKFLSVFTIVILLIITVASYCIFFA